MTIQAAGVTSAGFWAPTEATPIFGLPAFLADDIDPATGEYRSILSGADPTDAALLVALTTVRGSGVSVMETGQKFNQARMISPSLERYLREEVDFALRHLVEARQIRIDRVSVVKGDDWAELAVLYTNLATQVQRQVQLPLSSGLRRAA